MRKHKQNCITFGENTKASFFSIRSFNQQLQTTRVEKDVFSPFDDKRYLISEGNDTISYGHWKIRPDVSPEEKKKTWWTISQNRIHEILYPLVVNNRQMGIIIVMSVDILKIKEFCLGYLMLYIYCLKCLDYYC